LKTNNLIYELSIDELVCAIDFLKLSCISQ